MIGLPLLTMTAYLLWIWPRPRGTSMIAGIGPYLVSLLTGLPFAWRLSRGTRRAVVVPAFLAGGFVILWLHALALLCGVRGMCL
jgi:hypothetical protein